MKIQKLLWLSALFIYPTFFAAPKIDCPERLGKVARDNRISKLADQHIQNLEGNSELISNGAVIRKWDPELKTAIYHTSSAPNQEGIVPLVDPNAKAVVVYFHGSGTEKASGKNFVNKMNEIRGGGLSGIGVDLPFHKENRGDKRLNDMDYFMNWLHKLIGEAKKSGKPIYLVGHSFGPAIAQEYASRFPNDIEGMLLISPAPSKHPALKWTYENITEPGMKYIGGDTVVGENEAGGTWAGTMEDQFTWDKRPLPKSVKVKVILGANDEWWPGNSFIPGKLGVQQKYTMEEPLNWLKSHYPQGEFNVVPGVGHYIFDQQAPNGKNLITETMFDLAGIKPEDRYKSVQKTASEELALLNSINPAFREWIGNRYVHALSNEKRSAAELKGWSEAKTLAWKFKLENMAASDPEFAAARPFSIGRALAKLPKDRREYHSFNGDEYHAKLQGEYADFLRAKAAGKFFPLGADPLKPTPVKVDDKFTLPNKASAYNQLISLDKIQAFAKENGDTLQLNDVAGHPKLKELTFPQRGKTERRFVLSGMSEEELLDFVDRASLEAWKEAGYSPPSGRWEVEVDGLRVEGLVDKGKMIRFAILGPAPVKE